MKRMAILGLLVVFCLAIACGCASSGAEEGAALFSSPKMEGTAVVNDASSSEVAGQTGKEAVKKDDAHSETATSSPGATVIGKDAAVAAALKHAGLTKSKISRLEVELDYEDGRQIYDVEFYSGNKKYEYEIDSYTGKIRSYEEEIKKEPVVKGSGSKTVTSSPGATVIGKDAAVAAALKHAGLTKSSVSRLEVELDYEDGRQIYEIEFYYDNAEYDYEIDARTGAVLAYEYEMKKVAAAKDGATVIGKDAGMAAALKHAGLTQSKVSGLEVELDYEDGRQIYEVEFYYGDKEYEYEVDAYTGKIISYEVEVRKSSK